MSRKPALRAPEIDRQHVKAELRALIEDLGGLALAAREAGLSDSQLSRCALSTEPDLPSLDAAMRLERAAGRPRISDALVRMARRDFASAENLHARDGAAMTKQACAAIDQVAAAFADGAISPNESEKLLKQFRALDAAVAALKRKLIAKRTTETGRQRTDDGGRSRVGDHPSSVVRRLSSAREAP